MDQAAPLVQQAPEHPKNKAQQGQQLQSLTMVIMAIILILLIITNCTALGSECVAVFISIPLCRLAKPPVPQSHLWSPGKWLIWKYNHSSLDFISFLSDSLYSPSLLSLSPHPHFSVAVVSPHLPAAIAPSPSSRQDCQIFSSFILYFHTTFIMCFISSYTGWSIWRCGAAALPAAR